MTNPAGIANLQQVGGHLWDNQPVPEDIPEDYPTDPTVGNDDTGARLPEEDNDPYLNPSGRIGSVDFPGLGMFNEAGNNGDTMLLKLHFRELVRLNIGEHWYRISDYQPWRFHLLFEKNEDNKWKDDGSIIETNNNDF